MIAVHHQGAADGLMLVLGWAFKGGGELLLIV